MPAKYDGAHCLKYGPEIDSALVNQAVTVKEICQ